VRKAENASTHFLSSVKRRDSLSGVGPSTDTTMSFGRKMPGLLFQ
jgi:hypothetical protein